MLEIGPLHRTEYELDSSEPVVITEAPGRLVFLGEHGEKGAGLYLASAVNRTVQVAVSPRKDNSLRFFAADLGERKRTTLVNLKYKREDRWANYIKLGIFIFTDIVIIFVPFNNFIIRAKIIPAFNTFIMQWRQGVTTKPTVM